jgi:hypothetical protein
VTEGGNRGPRATTIHGPGPRSGPPGPGRSRSIRSVENGFRPTGGSWIRPWVFWGRTMPRGGFRAPPASLSHLGDRRGQSWSSSDHDSWARPEVWTFGPGRTRVIRSVDGRLPPTGGSRTSAVGPRGGLWTSVRPGYDVKLPPGVRPRGWGPLPPSTGGVSTGFS